MSLDVVGATALQQKPTKQVDLHTVEVVRHLLSGTRR